MEQVTFSALSHSAFPRGNQTLVFQNNQNMNLLNGDILQQALNGINTQISCEPEVGNGVQNSLISNINGATSDERVVQLSIREDFPLHLLNSFQNGNGVFSNDQQNLLDDILGFPNDISSNSLDLSTLLNCSPGNGISEAPQASSGNNKTNFTYAYQLGNGTKLNPVIQSIPIVPSNTLSQPNLVSDNGKDNQKPKLVILKNLNGNSKLVLNLNKPAEVSKNNVQKVMLVPSKMIVSKNPKTNVSQNVMFPPSKKPKQSQIQNEHNIVSWENALNYTASHSSAGKSIPTTLPILLTSLLKNQPTDGLATINNSTSFNSQLQLLASDKTVVLPGKVSPVKSLPQANSSKIPTLQDKPLESLLGDSEMLTEDASLLNELFPETNDKKKTSKSSQNQQIEKCTEEDLKKLSSAVKNNQLNLNDEKALTVSIDKESNTQIICKVLDPEAFMKDRTGTSRPQKSNNTKNAVEKSNVDSNEDANNKIPVAKQIRKKRKKKSHLKTTRSGRLSHLPLHIAKDYKKVVRSDESEISSDSEQVEEIAKIKAALNNKNSQTLDLMSPYRPPPDKYEKYKCPTCNKIYVGKKLFLHFIQNPDHNVDVDKFFNTLGTKQTLEKKNISINNALKKIFRRGEKLPSVDPKPLKQLLETWSDEVFLGASKERLSRLLSPDEYLRLRYSGEQLPVKRLLSDLDNILSIIPPNLLEKADQSHPNAINLTDERLCSVLNITPGSYIPNESSLRLETSQTNPITPAGTPTEMWPHPVDPDLGDNSKQAEDLFTKAMEGSLSLDKKASSVLSDILLDKTSLETVDAILNERLHDLMPLEVPSLVETQALARSIFSSNNLELHSVSASTEDLLKSLENLTPEIPSVSLPPPDFDFTVLSQDFGNDR